MTYIELNTGQLMDKILHALAHRLPLSVISVGVTEAHVLAQYTVYSEALFMNHPEADVENRSTVTRGHTHRGIRFPNIEARDAAMEAVRKADIVGISIRVTRSGELTRQVFEAYGYKPTLIFEAYTRRVIMLSQQRKFYDMLRNRKVIVVCSYADEVKHALESALAEQLGFEVTGAVKINQYEDIPRVKQEISAIDFDLCLIAAGINAVILASYIASSLGKVAFDIGQGMETLITGKIEGEDWLSTQVSMSTLLEM